MPLVKWDPTGMCSPEPRTDKECCDQAEKNGDDKGDAGGVVCCDGKKVSCGWKNPSKSKEADPYIGECIKKHEDDHHDDIGDCSTKIPSLDRPRFKKGKNRDEEECKAYKIERNCLIEKSKECKTFECRAAIETEIQLIEQVFKPKHKCTNF